MNNGTQDKAASKTADFTIIIRAASADQVNITIEYCGMIAPGGGTYHKDNQYEIIGNIMTFYRKQGETRFDVQFPAQ